MKWFFIISIMLAGTACKRVNNMQAELSEEDHKIFTQDSIQFYNYITQRDSLRLLLEDETLSDSLQKAYRSKKDGVEVEIEFLRDKWHGKLK